MFTDFIILNLDEGVSIDFFLANNKLLPIRIIDKAESLKLNITQISKYEKSRNKT